MSSSWNILEMADLIDGRRRKLLELKRRRQARLLLRKKINPFRDIPKIEFIKTFRLNKKTVKQLIAELTPLLPRPRRRTSLTPTMKVLIALSFYASGSYQTLVGQSSLINVSQMSVSRSVRQVTKALNSNSVFSKYVQWPTNCEKRNTIKAEFYNKFGIPGVLGCIDGTHVALIRPQSHEERFYNRKGFHSLNVMIICDSDLNIMCVDASHPGAAHDSSVWQSHPLSRHLTQIANNGEQVFLLGDSGYPLRKTLMTPILNTIEGTPEHHYYTKHITARNTIERCIGILKARFRCLLSARALHYKPITAGMIVNACCVLHNIANKIRAPVRLLTPEETHTEALFLQQTDSLRSESLSEMEAGNQHRVRPDLLEGRALQRALVNKLWRDRPIV